MHGLGVAEGPAFRDLDRVDVTDEVTDAGVGRGQLLAVPVASVHPRDRYVVAELLDLAATPHRDRRERVLVDLRAGDDRRPLVEQVDEGSDQARLALAALAEQDDVVPGEQRPLELGGDGVLEADDARERVLAGAQAGEQVVAYLVLDRAVDVTGRAEGAERRWKACGGRRLGGCGVQGAV